MSINKAELFPENPKILSNIIQFSVTKYGESLNFPGNLGQ